MQSRTLLFRDENRSTVFTARNTNGKSLKFEKVRRATPPGAQKKFIYDIEQMRDMIQ